MRYHNWWKLQHTKRGNKPLWYAAHTTPVPFAARAERVDHAFSAVLRKGIRHYAFYTEESRDKFLTDNPAAMATMNPLEGVDG